MKNNYPPFYVGQEVICIENFLPDIDSIRFPHKGETLTVRTISYEDGDWVLRFEEIINPEKYYTAVSRLDEAVFIAQKFRAKLPPMQEITYTKILEQEPVCAQ